MLCQDIQAAAAVMQGKQVAAGTRFLVIPASREVLIDAMRLGYIQTLVEAGATIGVGNRSEYPQPQQHHACGGAHLIEAVTKPGTG